MRILKFSLPKCPPCLVLAKQLKDNPLNVEIEDVDILENEELTIKYSVRNVPTLVVLDGEKEIKRLKNYSELKNFLENV